MSFKMADVAQVDGGEEKLVCTGNRRFKGCGREFVFSNEEKAKLMAKFGESYGKPKLCFDCRDRRRREEQNC